MRAALIKATLRAIAEDGPDGFTLRDVARRAGVSAAAPYRHFQDKDELLAAVAAECFDRLAHTIEAALAEATDHPLDQFRHIGIASVQFAAAHPEHFRALYVPGMLERLPAEQRRRIDESQAEQRRSLEAAREAGTIAKLSLDDMILAASALVHGLGHMIVEGLLGDVDAARAKELAIAATGVLGQGLIPRRGGQLPDRLRTRKS